MNETMREECKTDLNYGARSYRVDLVLLLKKIEGVESCAICNSPSFLWTERAKRNDYIILEVQVCEIKIASLLKSSESEKIIALDNELGLLIAQHIKQVLTSPEKEVIICSDCFSSNLLWILLDKQC